MEPEADRFLHSLSVAEISPLQNSASGRLSRLIFEGSGGLFGGGGVGAAVAGMGGVKSVADMTLQVRNAEWFVGRAYSLLQEVSVLLVSFREVKLQSIPPPPPLQSVHTQVFRNGYVFFLLFASRFLSR